LIGHEEAKLMATAQPALVAPVRSWQFFARSWVKRSLFLLADVISLTVANTAATSLASVVFRVPPNALEPSGYWLCFVPFIASVLYLLGGYNSLDLRRPEQELELAFKGVSVSFLGLLVANSLVFKGLTFSRDLIGVWYMFALLFLLCARWGMRTLYARLWRNGSARSRGLVIGDPSHFLRYQQLLNLQRHCVCDIVGVISLNGEDGLESAGYPVLGSLGHWEEIVRRQKIQVIALSLPNSEAGRNAVLRVIDKCKDLRVDVEVFADLFNPGQLNHEFNYFTGCFRLSSKPQWSRELQRICKRGLDWTFGIMGSLITLLITPVIALLVNLEDFGPVFYRREFVGCDGKMRYYLKFRTMVRNADQILEDDPNLKSRFLGNYKLREDPRTLRVGRFLRKYSIDEFPQFFSLLTGQLTLVGPRVIARDEKGRYGNLLQKRLSVKPGITGYWQVMGRQMTTYEERIHMDMFYIDHWSIWLDLFIIAKTFGKVIWPEGAY